MVSEDRTLELVEVLEVLAEEVDGYEAVDLFDERSTMLFAATWQVIELSMALFKEYNDLRDAMVATINEQEKIRESMAAVERSRKPLIVAPSGRSW